ncbi:unnamed protein product [Rotaria sp. Silwood2]|nr:unnamed protein product [Rotaria sp. Silwood2]CAF3965193.1 unnamed protein product [Rotaria sp. Silwood2]
MTITRPYTVPIIASDLRRAELVKQFADIFEHVEAILQDILNRVTIRLNVYRAQLKEFDERIQHGNTHIDHIQGSKHAIQVHSSATYPVEKYRSTYKSIFESDTYNEDDQPFALHYNLFHLNEAMDKFIDCNDNNSKSNDDRLIILNQYEDNFMQKTKKDVLNGLGRLPINIKSVVSLLKYRTKENSYIQSTKSDSLNVGKRIRKQINESTQPSMDEILLPSFHKENSERPAVDNFAYNPTIGLVPQLSLPDNLPELDKCATFDYDPTNYWDLPSSVITSTSPIESSEIIVPTITLTSTSDFVPIRVPSPMPPATALPSSLAIPPSLTLSTNVNESQTLISNEFNNDHSGNLNSGNSFDKELHRFREEKKLKPIQNSSPADKKQLINPHGSEFSAEHIIAEIAKRRLYIIGKKALSTPETSADNSDEDNHEWEEDE